MTEALKAIISFGFKKLGLNRIEAVVQPENVISKNLLNKMGFKEEGLLREYRFFKGNYVNLLMLSILKRELLA